MPNKIEKNTRTDTQEIKHPFMMMKVSEFASKFNISKDHVYRMLRDESLPKIIINETQYRVIVDKQISDKFSIEHNHFITVSEASKITGLSKRTIREAVKSKAIEGIQFDKTTRVSGNAIDSIMKKMGEALERRDGKYGTVKVMPV